MSKRQADTYLTKEPRRNRPDGSDIENERDKIDPVQIASEEVMATRKYFLETCVSVNLFVDLLNHDGIDLLTRVLRTKMYFSFGIARVIVRTALMAVFHSSLVRLVQVGYLVRLKVPHFLLKYLHRSHLANLPDHQILLLRVRQQQPQQLLLLQIPSPCHPPPPTQNPAIHLHQ